ncbi:MAPEG family protein [Pseudoalteromonas fenneropenaei]|uniref:MAPEG family protein n=1 Tax=Pseudoalteromonas fenneropenaei TaxID=1737459 RepID=A0ABV7CPC1_9GAMM
MTILLSCALLAVLLPYLAKIPVAYAQQQAGGYDNHQPRQQQATLTGLGARAVAAHQNCFEGLIIFAVVFAAVLATNTTGAAVQYLFVTHVVARVVYCICYWLDIHLLRSIVWAVGYLSLLAALVLCF